ncbi:hypothetical protein JIR001_09590 [Polycladomyces abyssicola]|uniref:DUF1002 domain-containing protein n=1 Tax=Polycladomyces abyssicola TaxID=1125966 RepID=A0A8D5UD31_9BACL|nr:DUF1002 domain-containing protein [Polycladomyces abyssicola]BCU81176.1 hypothetical protein JIR001_09590 [Polycladomyces abyssicola]
MKKTWLRNIGLGILSVFLFTLFLPSVASADAVVGETVVTLGQDLTQQERQAILNEMNVPNDVKIIEVTNAEEHQYLGKYLSKATIGSRALSSAKITLTDAGSGIKVQTHNITTITNAMYANALITAGVKDADVYVTAPKPVSGTAGLTGILKAFEAATGTKISEEQKQVANEEIVRTADLAKQIGSEKATQFMLKLKEEVAKQQPQTPEEFRDIVVNVAGDLNINLTNQQITQLTQFTQNLSNLNINWDNVSNQLKNFQDQFQQVLNSKEAQGFFAMLVDWFWKLVEWIQSQFR